MTDVVAEMPVEVRTLGKLLDVLVANGEYDAALELGQGIVGRGAAGTDEAVLDRFERARREIGELLELRRMAEVARERGWVRPEHEALTRARATMPQDRAVAEALRTSPVEAQGEILAVLAKLREANPAQETWRYHARIRRGNAELDLSGNAALSDVTALEAVPIHALELGGAAVRTTLPRMARLNDVGFRVALELAPPTDPQVLADHLVRGDGEAARLVALRLALRSENLFARDAGKAFLELAPLLEVEDRELRLGAIEGERAFGGNHYALVRVPLPWKEAERMAARLGGRLATVATEDEAAFIARQFLAPESAVTFWTSAVRRDDLDPWEWSSGGDAALLAARMGGAATGGIDSPESWRGVVFAAPPPGAPGESAAPGRWVSERHSARHLERHGFLVEWEGTAVGGPAAGLCARPSAGIDPTDEGGE